ncbi:MAG: dTDP-glucose 4,6-dehydratase [Proteobacteria bacterium]|nr:dTDP-glucose 4,6-dehydratase [Pseudomonadota bacterium]
MTRTILVTGGAGFIGCSLVRHLVGCGDRVVNLDALTYAGNRDNLVDVAYHPDHVFVHGSINDAKLVARLLEEHRPSAIINVAAETHVDRSIDGPAAFVGTNIVGAFQLLEAARAYWETLDGTESNRFRFVQVSTDEVYGSIDKGVFREHDPYRPNSPYAASKAGADHLARAYFQTFGLPVLITNGSNTYGPYQFTEKLLPLMILNAVDGKPLPVYGDGGNVRDWLYVADHSSGIVAALDHGKPGESYNLGGGNEFPNIDVVRRLCALLDEIRPHPEARSYNEQITFVADRPGHDFRYALDSAKAETQLTWRPAMDFEDGLRDTVGWYLDNQEWCRKITESRYDRKRLGLENERKAER